MDGLQDPGNVGTVIRTADAAGIDAMVDLYQLGDAVRIKVARANIEKRQLDFVLAD